MFFELNDGQREFLYDKSYKDLTACGLNKNTVGLLRKSPGKLHVETMARVLALGYGVSLKEFMLIGSSQSDSSPKTSQSQV